MPKFLLPTPLRPYAGGAAAVEVDGRTVAGTSTRAEEELPSREEALRLCTLGSGWFTFDDDKRGTLADGEFAALAELNQGLPERADR